MAACQASLSFIVSQSLLNSCPLSTWCHPTISFSVVPFSSCLQSFPASGSFPMSQLFASGGQSIGASASVLPVNIQSWFTLGLIGLFSLLSKGHSRGPSPTTQLESISSSVLSPLCGPVFTFVYDYWENHSFDYMYLYQQSEMQVSGLNH